MSVIEAADRTLDAGPSGIEATLRSGRVRYRLDGHLDPAGGYRVCAAIAGVPSGYLRGGSLWLEGRAGTFGTLTTRARRCARAALWLDDHPPTLELPEAGAEDFLHAALVALTGMRNGTVTAAESYACGPSQCYRIDVDFAALDRKPRQRDEDTWTLRPLLRSLGRHPVTLRVDSDGFLDRLVLAAPGPTQSKLVRVEIDLSRFGNEDPVPVVHADAIE
jgi:hypothetical protein